MFGIEEAAFGFAGILAGMVVVVAEMQTTDVSEDLAGAFATQGDRSDGSAMADLPPFLVGAVPFCREAFDVDAKLTFGLLEGESTEGEVVMVKMDVNLLGGETTHGEGYLLLFLLQFLT